MVETIKEESPSSSSDDDGKKKESKMFSIGSGEAKEDDDDRILGRITRTDTESSMEVGSEKDRRKASLIYARDDEKVPRGMSRDFSVDSASADEWLTDQEHGQQAEAGGMGPKKVSFVAGTSDDAEEGEQDTAGTKKKKKKKHKR